MLRLPSDNVQHEVQRCDHSPHTVLKEIPETKETWCVCTTRSIYLPFMSTSLHVLPLFSLVLYMACCQSVCSFVCLLVGLQRTQYPPQWFVVTIHNTGLVRCHAVLASRFDHAINVMPSFWVRQAQHTYASKVSMAVALQQSTIPRFCS